MGRGSHILTINSGSSSIKFSLYVLGETERLVLRGELGRIKLSQGFFEAFDHAGHKLTARELPLPDHEAAFTALFAWLRGHEIGRDLDAIGHRLVHGGAAHIRPQLLTSKLLEDLQLLVPLAPDHLPHEIKGLMTVQRHFPKVPQAVCFDTAFHRRLPAVAQRYALPVSVTGEELLHYGFHGLSYEYLTQELARENVAYGKLIIAHLGNGASMAAIEDGKSLDTTMGLTPTGGLMMSTRAGDLDPGVVLYLLREKGLSLAAVNQVLNHQAGLLGISGISEDMQDLLAQADHQASAALAVEMFCYQARKFAGALAAALGGLNTLVFAGGIGENSPAIRARICAPLEFLGLFLDPALNEKNAPIISAQDSPVAVRVMQTNEELMIARHTRDLIRSSEVSPR